MNRFQGIIALCIAVLLVGCGGDDGPKVPQAVTLSFPENNSECITGVTVSAETSEVEFRWQQSEFAATYRLTVTRIGSNLVENIVTSTTRTSLVLDKGAPYSWHVVGRNSSGQEGPASPTWQFYNAGAALSYPPFPAQIEAPASGAGLIPNTSGEILLQWSGADADNDLAAFEIYLGTDASAMEVQATLSPGQSSYFASVAPGTVYYWEVVSRDAAGNTSRSGVYSFRVF